MLKLKDDSRFSAGEAFMVRFQFQGFLPRWTFRRASNEWLGELMKKVPQGTRCHAVATRQDQGVLFSIELQMAAHAYRQQLLLDEAKAAREGVDWQVAEVQRLGKVINDDLKTWLEKNAETAPKSRRRRVG